MIRSLMACAALFWSVASAATLGTFGDWVLVDADDKSGDVIAATSTDSSGNEILALRCFVSDGKCYHVLSVASTCEEGAEYPMLLNVAHGASLIRGICSKSGKSELVLTPYDTLESSMAPGKGLLGVAIPMNSGAFRAVRFSLRGSNSAIEAAARLIQLRVKQRGPQPGSQTF